MTASMQVMQLPALSDMHRAYLNEHAVTDPVIAAVSIFSLGDDIIFPWRDGGQLTAQRRVWPEPDGGLPEGEPKYRWESGHPLHLWEIRSVDQVPAKSPVIIAEGTKQSLAVAGYAPDGYAVYGMPGCDIGLDAMLGQARLDRFAGHPVIVMLDKDAAENLNVWDGGTRLAEVLDLHGAAQVTFTRLPAQGKDGIDDFLAAVPDGRRAEMLAKLLAKAGPKPADRKPSHRPVSVQLPDTGGLMLVIVNADRAQVIHQTTDEMKRRWAGAQLFSYGSVITRLRGARTEPLDKDSFANWLIETVAPYKYIPPGLASPGKYEAAWPDPQTMGALLARGDEFPELTRISQTPFIRPDGTVCAKNGYDPDTGTMLIMGNSGMDRLDIPDAPSAADAAAAAGRMLDDWLEGFSFRDGASRANALALVLTPFVRGLVPLVPLAVISGLQMGVGKNLLADCIAGVVTGTSDVAPMPWLEDDDEENGKKIHAAFREGHSLMCFDEAHIIGGPSLTRAITAMTYSDRILGVSKMASYPNRVTWMALGNQVAVLADMMRRAYFIELYPDGPNPQNRDESHFRHPDLRTWTTDYRAELVTDALVILRAWFAAGCPQFPRGELMGSFEPWDKMMSGILGYAGVPGFLGNLATLRSERDTTGGFWEAHLSWLRDRFGTAGFTSLDVKTAAMAAPGTWEAPPRLEDPSSVTFTRDIGLAYARVQDRWFGELRIVRGEGVAQRKVAKWYIETHGEQVILSEGGTGGTSPETAPNGPDFGQTMPEQAINQSGGTGGTFLAPAAGETVPANGGLQIGQTLPEQAIPDPSVTPSGTANPGSPAAMPSMEGGEGEEGVLPLQHYARTPPRAHARVREGGSSGGPSTPPTPSRPPVSGFALGLDIETGDAARLFTAPRGLSAEEGGYVRLLGVIGPAGVPEIVSLRDALVLIGAAGTWYGHNVLGFDGLALAYHHGVDWDWLCSKARDTELIVRQVYPPRSRESGSSADKRGLDATAELLGMPGKTDSLTRLSTRHGGYDQIPLDDREYRDYLIGDMHATAGAGSRLLPYYDSDPYIRREHKLAQIAGHMSLNGFAVNRPLLEARAAAVRDQQAAALQALHDGWGLPLTKAVTRGRGGNKTTVDEPVKAPLATDEGRAWLGRMWEQYGVKDPPKTGTGKLALGSDALAPVAADAACPAQLRQMLDLMDTVTGSRTVYQTALDYLAADGRVHPKISFRQASGRWSVTEPGLTVFGKHEGRHVERDIFIPDQDAGEPHVLLSFDLKQVDMRGMAALSQDPAYMAMFGWDENGVPLDPHKMTAMQVYGSADPEHRQWAKAVGHGWNYGLGPARMIREGMDPERVWAFVNGMEARFPVLIGWREQIRSAGQAGLILDNGWGRRMMSEPGRAYTVAPALMGQGSARDIMCHCLLRLPPELWQFLRVMVHDEIVLSVPARYAAEIARIVTDVMTWEWRGVPILCDQAGPGQSWGEISDK